MSITPLPTPPSRATPSDFSTKADAFIAALPVFVTEANLQAAALDLNDTTDASTTSNAIATGAKTFTVTAGKSFQPGMWLMIADDAAPSTNWMHGQVTSYSATTLVMNIVTIGGSGTKTAWTISFSAPSGVTPLATGFTIAGGTTNKTLTVSETMTLGGYATAAEAIAGAEAAKGVAPDVLKAARAVDAAFWGIKNLRLIEPHAPGDNTCVVVNPAAMNIALNVGDHYHIMTAAVEVDSVTDLDTGALAAGTDYYIYACTDGATLSFKVSANSTNPTGFDAAHSRKIGGFHTLCVAVGAIAGHTLTNYAIKDILPASVWCLKHRAKTLVNVGLVYSSGINAWVDIYLQSGTGTGTTSVNGGAITDTRTWMDHVDDGNAVGKRLLRDGEFQSIAAGSNEETNIAGSADPGTTGGHSDTAGRRMISNIGCEDCCGALYQWLGDEAYIFTGTGAYWGNLPGGKGSIDTNFSANPGAAEMDNADAGSSTKLTAGGVWDHAAYCGSRYCSAGYYRWYAGTFNGARFVSGPL